MILGSVPLVTGLFAFTAWVLWKVSLGTTRRVALAPDPLALGTAGCNDLVPVRWRSKMRSFRVWITRQRR